MARGTKKAETARPREPLTETPAPGAKKRATKVKETASEIELEYRLVELPTSQHRTGLVGLVMMLRWLERQPTQDPGLRQIVELRSDGVKLRFDRRGIEELLDATYAATSEEQVSAQKRKDKNKQDVPPKREERRTVQGKNGKTSEKTFYIYDQVVPRGALLVDLDPTHAEGKGIWVKLWRDLTWEVLRGVPATRAPFEARAAGKPAKDVDETWSLLVNPDNPVVQLPSTYFVGAQAHTADLVPFKDRARNQFLLNFWPFAVQVYVPLALDRDGKAEPAGYALVFSDVADLEGFSLDLEEVLRARDGAAAGFRPRAAMIDLPIAGGVDFLGHLAQRIADAKASRKLDDLVLGLDVVHIERDGNNVRLRGQSRVPASAPYDAYRWLRQHFWSPFFRRQVLSNLLAGRPHHDGFDRLMAREKVELVFDAREFRHDAKTLFAVLFQPEGETMSEQEEGASARHIEVPKTLEQLVFRIVQTYVLTKLEWKHGLQWNTAKASDEGKGAFNEAKAKIAREAFLAVRSRTDADFVEYFAGTLCSVPQRLPEEAFLRLTTALADRRDDVRTLTMLALAAQG